MARYRKKPVEVEAIKFGGSTSHVIAINKWIAGSQYVEPVIATSDIKQLEIETLEGTMIAKQGDYVIKGVAEEFYPCKPDIFAQTYELVEEWS
jgi:hypothetical protein